MIDDPDKTGIYPIVRPPSKPPWSKWEVIVLAAILCLLVSILASCASLTRDEKEDRIRQLEAQVKTYQEEVTQLKTNRLLERETVETPTADGGKHTVTRESEQVLTDTVRTLKGQVDSLAKERDELKRKMEAGIKVDGEGTMAFLTPLVSALTGGAGGIALLLPKILGLMGQRGRLIDAVQNIKDEVCGNDEKRRDAANKAAQRALNDSDHPVIVKHKMKRKASRTP